MITNPSTMNWQQVFDFTRRQNASSVQVSPSDAIMICQLVSSRIWTSHPWQFTLTTSPAIPCGNGQQTYPMPADCYRLVKAWIRFPQPVPSTSSTVPPYSDPSLLALQAALASQAYLQNQGTLVTTPPYYFYALDVVKLLDNNLYPRSATGQTAITQVGNAGEWRLSSATYVPDNQPYALFGQYQPFAPKIWDLGKPIWFSDNLLNLGEAGILYYLYKANGDERAGAASFQDGRMGYSGQLAVWMSEIEQAADEEREGSIDSFVPSESLGNEWNTGYWIP